MTSEAAADDQGPPAFTPSVSRIISDHAGTVLNDPEPAPTLTVAEERRAVEVYHELADKAQARRPSADEGEEKGADEPSPPGGLSLKKVDDGLRKLGLALPDDLFERVVVQGYWQPHRLDKTSGTINQRQFLDLYAEVYTPGLTHGARLRKACGRGQNEMVRELVCRGCNPLGHDGGGFSAMHYSAEFNRVETMELLLSLEKDQGALVNHAGPKDDTTGRCGQWTPLMVAASNGHVDAVKFLLAHKANPRATTTEKRNAVHWAAAKGKEPVLIALLQADKSLVVSTDISGFTPLHVAAMHGHVPTMISLVEHGAQIEAEDRLGNNAESYCVPEHWAEMQAVFEAQRAEAEKLKKKKKSNKKK